MRLRREKYGWRELGRQIIRKIEVYIEAAQIAVFLAPNLVDLSVREDLSASGLFNVRQRHEACR